jgi:hypothetical protein
VCHWAQLTARPRRQVAYLRDHIQVQQEGLTTFHWRLAAKEAEANHLREKLVAVEGGRESPTDAQPVMAACTPAQEIKMLRDLLASRSDRIRLLEKDNANLRREVVSLRHEHATKDEQLRMFHEDRAS